MQPTRSKVFIADDDEAILDALTIIMETAGYKVETSTDARALINYRGKLPDLILLDALLSGVEGGEVCRRLKHSEQTSHIPVILVSAKYNLAQYANEYGADDFLCKPFKKDELLQKVDALINKSHEEKHLLLSTKG